VISILIPCFNEEKSIAACLVSVLAFRVPAGQAVEILVIDGRSTDSTREIVERIAAGDRRVRLLDNPQRIQSHALNLGIGVAQGEWVMRLDAHTHYPPEYLEKCHEVAVRTGADNVGGVWNTRAGGEGYGARLVQALTTHWFGVGNSGFRTGAKAGPRDTVPFGFFRREVFDRVGLFDERLVRTQDYEFNRRIRAAGGVIYLDPLIQSDYFNLPTLEQFLRKQFHLQGQYNAYMWYLAPYAFEPRHAVSGCFALFVLLGAALAALVPALLAPYAGVLALYGCLALAAGIQQAIKYRDVRHALFLPPCFPLFHLFHGAGVLVGLLKLLTGTSPVQRTREPWPGAGRFRAWPRGGAG